VRTLPGFALVVTRAIVVAIVACLGVLTLGSIGSHADALSYDQTKFVYDSNTDDARPALGAAQRPGAQTGGDANPGEVGGEGSSEPFISLVAPGSILDDASRAAFDAADNVGSFSVKPKHLPGGGGKYNKFDYGVDPNAAIREALTSDAAQFLPNPNLPNTFRVVTDLGRPIGTKGQTSIRVIVGMDGQVINAFPVKVR